jgi:hypothetical protein
MDVPVDYDVLIDFHYSLASRQMDAGSKQEGNPITLNAAARNFRVVAELLDKKAQITDDPEEQFLNRILKHCNLQDAWICEYRINNINHDRSLTISAAWEASYEATAALELIDTAISSEKDEEKKNRLRDLEQEMFYSRSGVIADICEATADQTVNNGQFQLAVDQYNYLKSLRQNILDEGLKMAGIGTIHQRILKGNIQLAELKASNARICLLQQMSRENKFQTILDQDLVQEIIHYYDTAQAGFLTNMEVNEFRLQSEKSVHLLKEILSSSKDKWLSIITQFNHPLIKSTMLQIDPKQYKKQLAKTELQTDITKKFLITGLFWLSVFATITYLLIYLGQTEISWYRFIGILFGIPLLFTIIGAFTLRSTDALKEENFMKLISLALRINFQGLKVLSGKTKNGK